MFNIFVAVFGSIFYGTKYASEKQKLRNAEKIMQHQRLTRESWLNLVTDRELEFDLKCRLQENVGVDQIWGEIRPVIASLSSCRVSDKEKYLNPYDDFFGKQTMRILLAKRGKIPAFEASYHVSCPGVYDPTVRRLSKQCKEVLLWTQGELENHGVFVSLAHKGQSKSVYKKGKFVGFDDSQLYTPLMSADQCIGGEFVWRFEEGRFDGKP